MKTMNHYARTSALPAIAAALALSSTSALAQQAQPVPADPPASSTTDQPAPATQAVPAASDTSAAPSAVDSAAPATAAKTASTSRPKSVKRTARVTHAAARTPAPRPAAATHVASRSVATHAVVPAPTPAPAAVTQTSQSAVKPLVDVNASPAPKTTAAAKPAKKHDDTLPIAGGALAFLAIGGAAVAFTRRRHDEEEEWVEEGSAEPVETYEGDREPVVHDEEPAMIAPAASAFSWGERDRSSEVESRNLDAAADDDRLPGETWIQRAYRGPTPNNPSVSLRARLKRAAFFDKRERDVAAGRAEPVDMDAGLPEAMVEEQERELA